MQIDRDGTTLHYDVAGSGPALLLTHGYTASGHMFSNNIAALAERNTVITWDMRGHGRSDYPTDPSAYTPEISIADMLAVLDAVGVERAVIAGHSLGGYLSLTFNVAHPERVAALVLIDTGPGYRKAEARAGWNDLAEQFAVGFETRGLDALGSSEEVVADVHRDASGLVLSARGVLAQRDAVVIDSLPRINVPTLVIVGDEDAPFLDGSKYMAAKIPGARLEIIAGAGHAPNIARPAEFDRILSEFLASVPAAT
ncbi:MAG: alpha/beta hydrolase [Ilumatobacteraceae bacterium]|jgi:pimeloyl-ACP methyl ester carboxylesterase|nr:alpha/beta hydrolase [Ilumatobacteraceae bacterium]